jgi:NCS1 family nucleobase:cation symporter-1
MWLSFAMFWGLNILVVYRGMDLLRRIENWAAPYVLVMAAILVWWAVDRAHGLGPILRTTGRLNDMPSFIRVFVPSLTAIIGFWATLSLNMPDFTRFGQSQRAQVVGQVVALPTTMTVFAAMGVMITSATSVIYGTSIWDPMDLAARFTSRTMVAVSMFTVVIATLAVNIAANVVSPANDFANAFPRWITFRRGGLITGLIGIAMCPWKLIADPSGYIFTWLLGYSGGLGSIAGVLIVDYWLLKRTRLDLADLYRPSGRYAYGSTGGTNWMAVLATAVGCLMAWIGKIVPSLIATFDYAWFIGGIGSGALYWIAMRILGDASARDVIASVSPKSGFVGAEAASEKARTR